MPTQHGSKVIKKEANDYLNEYIHQVVPDMKHHGPVLYTPAAQRANHYLSEGKNAFVFSKDLVEELLKNNSKSTHLIVFYAAKYDNNPQNKSPNYVMDNPTVVIVAATETSPDVYAATSEDDTGIEQPGAFVIDPLPLDKNKGLLDSEFKLQF